MRFEELNLSNYRCYKDVHMDFTESPGKSITLIIGVNGSGKTELRFAFKWILYDVDFKSIKGKESADYALNIDVANAVIEKGEKEASVRGELKFEVNGIHYAVVKEEDYSLEKGRIAKKNVRQFLLKETVSQSWVNVAQTPETTKIALSKLLPLNLLNGLIFDGEAMEEIASPDSDKKRSGLLTIKGVISKVVNVEVLSIAKDIFSRYEKSLRAQINKLKKGERNLNIHVLQNQIDQSEENIKKWQAEKSEKEEAYSTVKSKLDILANQLRAASDTHEKFVKRELKGQEIESSQKHYDELYPELQASLQQGYYLMTDEIMGKVKQGIANNDIPEALTVEAAYNILERQQCICGHDMTDEMREIIKALIPKLPPANIDSQLKSELSTVSIAQETKKKEIAKERKQLMSIKKEIQELRDLILSLDKDLAGSDNNLAQQTISSYTSKETDAKVLKSKISELELLLIKERDLLNKNISKHQNLLEKDEACSVLSKRAALCFKYCSAIELFEKYQMIDAMNMISEKLDKAYAELSEDYDRGRRLTIIKYDTTNKYKLVPYYEDVLESQLKINKAEYDNDVKINISLKNSVELANEKAREVQIIKSFDPSSDGQLAIQALAFTKAIMDYTTSIEAGLISSKDSYPLVIDSPFSMVGGKNLNKASSALPDFSEQIILLVSDKAYANIKANIEEHVNTCYEIFKSNTEGHNSEIKRIEA